MSKTNLNIAYLGRTGANINLGKIDDIEITSPDNTVEVINKTYDEATKVLTFELKAGSINDVEITSSDNSVEVVSKKYNEETKVLTLDLKAVQKEFTSSDNSLIITDKDNNVDLKVKQGDLHVYWAYSLKELNMVATDINNNGKWSSLINVMTAIDFTSAYSDENGSTTYGNYYNEATKTYDYGDIFANSKIEGYGKMQNFLLSNNADCRTLKITRTIFDNIKFTSATNSGSAMPLRSQYMIELGSGGSTYFNYCQFSVTGQAQGQPFIRFTQTEGSVNYNCFLIHCTFEDGSYNPWRNDPGTIKIALANNIAGIVNFKVIAANSNHVQTNGILDFVCESGMELLNFTSDGKAYCNDVNNTSVAIRMHSIVTDSIALKNPQNVTNGELCIIDADGKIAKISIADLKTLLGI